MIDYSPLVERWTGGPLSRWADNLQTEIEQRFHSGRYGDLPRWLDALERLPTLEASDIDLSAPTVRVGRPQDCRGHQRQQLEQALRELHPWRKGPFELFGVRIDTEWRSDWKWERLKPALETLNGRRVLDVGCGSGYHAWRMLGDGAAEVIGIDPTPLFVVQFHALQRYIGNPAIWVLPLGIEQVPHKIQAFDTVFSMGILYHRRHPIEHLMELRDALTPGGQLILETLVIEGDANTCLVPSGRYARMGNVWFIPSCEHLMNWLTKLGMRNVELIDVNQTSIDEQRSTDWMTFQSLKDFLDPADPNRTIEGYPAPRRAIITANSPAG